MVRSHITTIPLTMVRSSIGSWATGCLLTTALSHITTTIGPCKLLMIRDPSSP